MTTPVRRIQGRVGPAVVVVASALTWSASLVFHDTHQLSALIIALGAFVTVAVVVLVRDH